MEIAEFERCINLGLGRAILYLQKHSSEPYRDAILYACLHNTIYDTQLENDKGEYIRDLIRLSKEESFYRQRVFKTLRKKLNHRKKRLNAHKEAPDRRDIFNLLAITSAFAKHGDTAAKALIYELFDKTIKTKDIWCSGDIIDIDGIDGFVYVAEKIIENGKDRWDDFRNDYWVWELEERFGEETVQAKFAELRATNPKLDAYLKVLDTYRASQQTKSQSRTSTRITQKNSIPSYEDLRPNLKSWDISRLWRWGQDTDDENLIKAAIDLEQESDRLLLRKYLAIFRYAPYLRSPQKLIALTSHSDAQISHWSFEALANIESSEVREFALRVLVGEEKLGQAVSLLKVNFEEEDWELIEAAIEKTTDAFENHYLQMNVRDIAEIHPSPNAVKNLLMLYEYGVCTLCRFSILRSLVSLNALPESIRDECFHDSNPDIREWAKKGFPLERDDSLPKSI